MPPIRRITIRSNSPVDLDDPNGADPDISEYYDETAPYFDPHVVDPYNQTEAGPGETGDGNFNFDPAPDAITTCSNCPKPGQSGYNPVFKPYIDDPNTEWTYNENGTLTRSEVNGPFTYTYTVNANGTTTAQVSYTSTGNVAWSSGTILNSVTVSASSGTSASSPSSTDLLLVGVGMAGYVAEQQSQIIN